MASLMVMSESLLPTTQRATAVRQIPSGRRTGAANAAVDFSAYLLAASPPGFDLQSAARGVLGACLGSDRRLSIDNSDIQPIAPRWKWMSSSGGGGSSSGPPPPWSSCRQEFSAVLECPSSPSDDSNSDDSETSSPTSPSPDGFASAGKSAMAGHRRRRLTKKVSFADDLGQLLEQIKVFSESSDTPPNISPRIIRRHHSVESLDFKPDSIANGIRRRISPPTQHSSPFFRSTSEAAVSCANHFPAIRLTPNFAMPIADRSYYLDRVDRLCVSLESIGAPVEDLTATRCARCGCLASANPSSRRLVGSVGVKNISFEKTVTVRASFNGWLTHVDVHAVYARSERAERCAGARGHDGDRPRDVLPFDVFEFSVNIPAQQLQRAVASGRGRLRVEIAICYEAAGQKFWDNNDGQNYEMIGLIESRVDPSSTPSLGLNTTDAIVFGRGASAQRNWSEFSSWNAVDETCPYW
jgi:protein phosphatase 1 regulatory subunit 3A/B/C/D/E